MFFSALGLPLAILVSLLQKTAAKPTGDRSRQNELYEQHKRVVKRGHFIGNDFGPAVQVSSGILHLQHTAAGDKIYYDAVAENPWQASGVTAGYEVWLDSESGLKNYQPMHAIAADLSREHWGATHEAGSVFSSDTPLSHLGDAGVSSSTASLGGHLASVLNTQISSSSSGHKLGLKNDVSGNIDFSEMADLAKSGKQSSRSYGR